ncbi:unnamed protein product, partial [Rotaria sp. Silwood1]
KHRSQLKQAITKMIQKPNDLVNKTPDLNTKSKLIETLPTITTGKIFVENERARSKNRKRSITASFRHNALGRLLIVNGRCFFKHTEQKSWS